MKRHPGLELLVTELLSRELGHVPRPLPGSLVRRIRSLARAADLEPAEWLARVIARKDVRAIEGVVAAATVPHTAFFRHPDQLEHFGAMLPLLARRRGLVRVWSAGCATGEEPYSLALVARDVGVPVRILATDVSEESLQIARRGEYGARGARGLPGASSSDGWTAPDAIRRVIQFERSSLAARDPARGQGPFDVIFCRNVLIYFETERALSVVKKLLSMLEEGGSLVVAPTETVLRAPWQRPTETAPLGWFERPARRSRPKSVGPAGALPVPSPRLAHTEGGASEPRTPLPALRSSTRPPSPTSHRPEPALDEDLERAARSLASGDPDAAETSLRAHLNRLPDDAEAWFLLGEALVARGERGQARAAFLRASRAAQAAPGGARRAMGGVEASTLDAAARRRAAALE